MKLDKLTYNIYADIESLIRKIDGCANIPEDSSPTKIGQHVPFGYSMSIIWGFNHVEKKHTLYRIKGYIKKFCTSLSEHAKDIIDFEKIKVLPLTKEELKSDQDAKLCYICGKIFIKKFANDKNYRKVRDHSHYTRKCRGAAHSICNLKFNMPNEFL